MTHIITCSSIIVSAYCLLPAFVVVILKFYFNRLNNRSTCQRLLYKYKISSPLYSIPSVVITTIQPEQNKVSCVIWFWFFEVFLCLRFLALRACSSGSFCTISVQSPFYFYTCKFQRPPPYKPLGPLPVLTGIPRISFCHLHHTGRMSLVWFAGLRLLVVPVHKYSSAQLHILHLPSQDRLSRT